jgi:integrase
MLMVPNLRVVEPNNIFRKVPTRRPNAQMRTREYLTPHEVERLIAAAKLGRHGHRDATLILVAFRHGLRAVEVADLEWSQVESGRNPALQVRRAKTASPLFTLSGVMNCACCASCSGIRRVRSSSRLSAAGR